MSAPARGAAALLREDYVGDYLDLADVVAERVNPPGFAPFDGPEFLEIDPSPGVR